MSLSIGAGDGATVVGRERSRRRGLSGDAALAYLMVAPAMLLVAALLGYPSLYSLWLSLHSYQLTRPQAGMTFAGLENFLRIPTDDNFLDTVQPTLLLGSSMAVAGIVVCLAFALILAQPFRGRRVAQVCLLIPWATPGIVVAMLWGLIYNAQYGILGAILVRLGLVSEYPNILGEPANAVIAIVVAETWRWLPLATLLLTAGLGYVPENLYRAAKMDGAGVVGRFRHVTLPGIRYHVMIVLILSVLHSLRIFEILYLLTQGGPGQTTMVLNYYIYRVAFGYLDLGYGSALSLMLSLVLLGLSCLSILALGPRRA